MGTDFDAIAERLREAQYAVRCAQGAGTFGPTEQTMLKTFQEHALADVEALLDCAVRDDMYPSSDVKSNIEALVTLVMRTRRDVERAAPAPAAAALEGALGFPTLVLETTLSDADKAAVGRFLNEAIGRVVAAEEAARVATAAVDVAVNRELDTAEAAALQSIVSNVDEHAALAAIGERIRTQDNHITEAPIFIVQEKKRIYGISKEVSTQYAWVSTSDHCEVSKAEAATLERRFGAHGRKPKGFAKSYYIDTWRFVTACFTEAGCEAYLKINGHNLREPRIYVESGWRNKEWIFLREWLAKIPPTYNELVNAQEGVSDVAAECPSVPVDSEG